MTTKKAAKTTAEPKKAEPAKPVREPGLKIFAMRLENIKKVSFVQIRPKGDMVYITGPNGSGKTSILDAIEWGITGTSKVPSQPIKKGQNAGRIQIDLGDFKLTRRFTRVDPTKSEKGRTYITDLVLEGKNRETFKSPQNLLDSFMGRISFDPLEFTRMDDKKQLETLRGLVTLDVDLDKIEAEKREAYDARRDAGRDLDSANNRLAALPPPAANLPAKPIDTDALTLKLQNAANHNSVIASRKQEQARRREFAQGITLRMAATNREIDELRERILKLEESLTADHNAQRELIAEADAMKFEDPIDTAEVAAELSQAQTINGAIARRDVYTSVKLQVTTAEETWKKHDDTVKAKDAERAAAIARAKMPIPGLSIGDGEVLFNELPFSQASNAEQIAVSTSLAMASNPKLRVLRIKDGSLLDDKSLELIAKMAGDHDYQIWIERVEAGDAVGIVMEDGEASGDQVEEVKH